MSTSDPKAVAISPDLVSTSADEVERTLRALLARREPLWVLLGDGESWPEWRLRFVDPARQYIVVESTLDGSKNASLLERERVTFFAEFSGMHVEFTAERSRQQDKTSAVRLGFPAVTVNHRQRAHRRTQVASLPLGCVILLGEAALLDGQIMDITEGGVGLFLRAVNIIPAPGTIIRSCRIEHPEKIAVVDFEVRHCKSVVFADGGDGYRWGCQFLNPSDEVQELIALLARAITP